MTITQPFHPPLTFHHFIPTDACGSRVEPGWNQGGGLFLQKPLPQLLLSHWFAACPGGPGTDQSPASLAASQWSGGGHCVPGFNESFVVWQFRGGRELVFVRIFPEEKSRVGAVGGGGDQGSPTLERFANRFDFQIFKTS